jgi:Tfp pilus assembly protein PilO
VNAFLRTKKGMIVAGIAGLAAVLAAGWLLVVSPERKQADDLAAQVVASEAELAQKRAELARPSAAVRVKADDLFRLSKALPSQVDSAGVLLDLDRVAKQNGLTFWAVTPVQAVPTTDVLQQPYDVVLEGRFTSVSKFLREIRKLVAVKGGRLAVQGRLYTVDQLKLEEPQGGETFPIVRATVRVNAFSFTPAVPTTPGTTDTTTTTTTDTGTVAAGATP